jgi:thiol-disulfide isomerase/thioredoxin
MKSLARAIFVPTATLALTLALSVTAAAQDASQPPSDSAKKSAEAPAPAPAQVSSQIPAPQQVAENNFAPQSDQPMSLGELARLARAKRKDDVKASKVIDDENMPRGGIYIGGSAPDSSSTSSGRASGKLVLLDFWASWCGPCRKSLPDLKRLQSVYGSDQLEVISISEDEDEHAWSKFVSQNQMNWEQRFDAGGASARRYGARALPTYILMDSSGTVLQRYEGEDPEQSLSNRIGPELKKAQEPKRVPPTS